MKKTLKRLLACVAVVMMVFCLCTTAFAAYPTGDDDTINPSWKNMPVIKKGSENVAVRGCQQFLQLRGYNVGSSIDGIFGTNTQNAVKAYQADRGLTADGVCGAKTWDKMRYQLYQYDVGSYFYSYHVSGTSVNQDRFKHQHSSGGGYGSVIGSWWVEYGPSRVCAKMCN